MGQQELARAVTDASGGAAALCEVEGKGRGVVALRPLRAGSLVLQSDPLLCGVAAQLWSACCHGCLRCRGDQPSLADKATAVFALYDADGDGRLSFAEAAQAQRDAPHGGGELTAEVWEYMCARAGASPAEGLTLAQHMALAREGLSEVARDYAAAAAAARVPASYPATLWRRPRAAPAPLLPLPEEPYPERLYSGCGSRWAFECRSCGVVCCSAPCAAQAHPTGAECGALGAVRRAAETRGLAPAAETLALFAARACCRALQPGGEGLLQRLQELCTHSFSAVAAPQDRAVLQAAHEAATAACLSAAPLSQREDAAAGLAGAALLAQHFNAFGAWDPLPASAVQLGPRCSAPRGAARAAQVGGAVFRPCAGGGLECKPSPLAPAVPADHLELDCPGGCVLLPASGLRVPLGPDVAGELRALARLCSATGAAHNLHGEVWPRWDLEAFGGGTRRTSSARQVAVALHHVASLLNHQGGGSHNLRMDISPGGRMLLYAGRDIAEGEELTIQYGADDTEVRERYAFPAR